MWQKSKTDVYVLLKLILPFILTGLMGSMIYFFETIFLSHLTIESMAAGALVTWLYSVFVVIVFGILSAVNILIAHQYGRRNHQGIGDIFREGFYLALLLFVISFLLFWFMPPLFIYLGQQPEIVDLTKPYLHAIAWGLLPNFILIVLMELVIGIGHTRVLLVLTIFDVLAAILLSYILIFGLYGFPKLGIAGSGWGISISNFSSMLGLAFYCSLDSRYQPYFKSLFTFKKLHYLYELIKIGLPLGLMYCIEVAYFFGLTLLAGQYGNEVMAANQIALQYLGVMIGVLFSISQAITVRMGHLIGSKNRSSAKRTCAIGLLISFGMALLIGFFELNYSKYMIALDFNMELEKNQQLIQYAIHFLVLTVVFQIFEAIRLTFLAALRALKDTYYCLWTSILTFWFIALPLGYIFSNYLALGVYGLWYGALVAIIIGCFFLYKRVVGGLTN